MAIDQQQFDVVVIGAGAPGAAAAHFLSRTFRVALLEAEEQYAYHSTGRSAAVFAPSYGNETVMALTAIARKFYKAPPVELCSGPLLSARGFMLIAPSQEQARLDEEMARLRKKNEQVRWMEAEETRKTVPILTPDYSQRAIYDPMAMDIDVHALHSAFLKGAKNAGAQLAVDSRVEALTFSDGLWSIDSKAGALKAKYVVNAAGAWAGEVGRLAGAAPISLSPRRRTAIIVDAPADQDVSKWPLVVDAGERFYFKPESGALLISPANEDESAPCDVQPEDLDIAIGVDRFERATHCRVDRVRAKWAGLRTFADDRKPVIGFDAWAPNYIWLAGLGGAGVQTAPAAGRLAATLIEAREGVGDLAEFEDIPGAVSPCRFSVREETGAA